MKVTEWLSMLDKAAQDIGRYDGVQTARVQIRYLQPVQIVSLIVEDISAYGPPTHGMYIYDSDFDKPIDYFVERLVDLKMTWRRHYNRPTMKKDMNVKLSQLDQHNYNRLTGRLTRQEREADNQMDWYF